MIRLAIVAFGAFVLSQTPAVERLAADVRDFRERQHLTGQRIGCQMKLASAAASQDLDRVNVLMDRCAELERRQNQL